MMRVLNNKADFNSFISSELSLVAYISDGCPPCKLMLPTLNDLSKKFKNSIEVGIYLVNDLTEEPIVKYGIRGTPEIILFTRGTVIHKWGGRQTYDELDEVLTKIIKEGQL